MTSDPINITPRSYNGAIWVFVFKDKNSHYIWCYEAKKKSDALNVMKEHYNNIINKGFVIKRLETDYDSIFLDEKFAMWCIDKQITQVFSNPHVHQQNGYIERGIQTLLDKVRTLHISSRCPHKYWPLTFKYAALILNCTIQAGMSTTPFQLVHGLTPPQRAPTRGRLAGLEPPALHCASAVIFSQAKKYIL